MSRDTLNKSDGGGHESGTTLDLGLSDLLAEPKEQSIATPLLPNPTPPEIPLESKNPLNEFELLAERGAWQELSALCDAKVAASGEGDGEARLWWVKSQLKCRSMPLSLLAAPLDSVSSMVLAGDSVPLKKFSAELLREVAAELSGKEEYGVAISFLERAYRSDGTETAALLKAIEREKNRLTNLKDYGRETVTAALLKDLEKLRLEIVGQSETVKAEVRDDLASVDLFKDEQKKKISSPKPFPWGYALFVSCLLVTAYGWSTDSFSNIGQLNFGIFDDLLLSESTDRTISPSLAPSEGLPVTKSIEAERITKISHLDTLYYDLENAASKKREGVSPSPGVKEAAVKEPSEQAKVVAPREITSKEKEVVNTTSPVEPIKTQGRGEKSSPTTGRSASATQTRKEALPFEKFSGGKVYSIIVATRVMDRPSFRTVPIAKLQRGDTVLVEAQVGDWLKLRSKKGSPGYILAQEAKEQRD